MCFSRLKGFRSKAEGERTITKARRDEGTKKSRGLHMKKPKVVVLCGSSRFVEIMAVCAWMLERDEGAIALGLHLLPWWYAKKEEIPDHLAEHEGVAEQMDELHLRKIDLADEVFVVSLNGYKGESTRREIAYAESKGIPVRYLEEKTAMFKAIVDKIIAAGTRKDA